MNSLSYKDATESETFKLYKRIAEFSIPIYYVTQSYKQLTEYIDYIFQTTQTISWALYDPFPNAGAEIDRLFFNFLSSTTLLIDTTRVFIADLQKSNISINDYERRKNELFAENPLIKIIKELRNSYTHNRPVMLTERITYTQENSEYRQLIFDKVVIQSLFKEPNNKLKSYLEENNYEIDISKLTTEYYNIIIPFYQWLNSELKGRVKMVCH